MRMRQIRGTLLPVIRVSPLQLCKTLVYTIQEVYVLYLHVLLWTVPGPAAPCACYGTAAATILVSFAPSTDDPACRERQSKEVILGIQQE